MIEIIRIDIQDMTSEHCINTITNVLNEQDGGHKTKVKIRNNQVIVSYNDSWVNSIDIKNTIIGAGFKVMDKPKNNIIQMLAASIIFVIGIIGCSDVPFSGPILSVENVDRYLDSTGADTVCLQDGFDTICLRVKETINTDTAPIPVISLYPESIIYHFYYDNKTILIAERIMDTAELVQELIDSGKLDLPPGSTAPKVGNMAKGGEGWTIKIYYPESFPEEDRGTTLETSGLDIRVSTGRTSTINKEQGLELENFKQHDEPDGRRNAEFSVITVDKEITIQVDGLVEGYIVRFYIDVDGVASDEGNIFQLEPK